LITFDNGFHVLLQHPASALRPHALHDGKNSFNGRMVSLVVLVLPLRILKNLSLYIT